MKLAFSTLGCPNWELKQITETARRLGYDGIELRALGGSLDLLARPEFAPTEIANTRAYLDNQQLAICCVDTSCAFHSPDRSERLAQVELAVAHAELAAALGAPLIRVFPDKIQPGANRVETSEYIVECLRQIAEAMPSEVLVGLETHGDFARAEISAEIVTRANHPNVKLIWDVANSVAAGDSITEAAPLVEPYLAHVHLRDARPTPASEHWLPVLAGRGNISFAETLAVLTRLNYDGYVSFEWEKYWQPGIEEPEIALPDFIGAIRNLVGDSRDTTKCSGVGK
ncbi:MAG TPA: sugar phosphate isomerase/epimerase family protein [Pyrinomonadaceae bacterium]|nr:sugar phosphate isomerase/epimerase family protein [Pyrinomonadaceae bacterium]